MSKAFTKDEGEAGEAPSLPVGAPLPEGARNYVTPVGAAALQEHLGAAQRAVEQLRAAGGPAFLAARDQLIFWQQRFDLAEVVKPPAEADDRVRFGATVELQDDSGEHQQVRIVGVDEVDARHGDISWASPLARGLMGRQVGDEIELRAPRGVRRLEIVAVRYGARE
jgi:transcription elongation factor GreB